MIPDDSVAYALAAWSRFDGTVSDGLLRAVAGAHTRLIIVRQPLQCGIHVADAGPGGDLVAREWYARSGKTAQHGAVQLA